MAELEINVDTQDSGTPEPEQKEVTVEDRARAEGWRPKEEFDKDESEFVDAKEFLARKPLFEKIEALSKQNKNINKTLDALKVHHGKVEEAAYKRALADLKMERMNAITEGDGVKFEAVENKIKQAEDQFKQATAAVATPPDPSEFVAWRSKNNWYEKDADMREYADEVGIKFHREGLSPAEVLDAVSKKVRAVFPHKFVNQNKANAPDVGVSSGRSSRAADDSSRYELDETEKSIMNTLVNSKTMTKEEYIKQLKAIKARGR